MDHEIILKCADFTAKAGQDQCKCNKFAECVHETLLSGISLLSPRMGGGGKGMYGKGDGSYRSGRFGDGSYWSEDSEDSSNWSGSSEESSHWSGGYGERSYGSRGYGKGLYGSGGYGEGSYGSGMCGGPGGRGSNGDDFDTEEWEQVLKQ